MAYQKGHVKFGNNLENISQLYRDKSNININSDFNIKPNFSIYLPYNRKIQIIESICNFLITNSPKELLQIEFSRPSNFFYWKLNQNINAAY